MGKKPLISASLSTRIVDVIRCIEEQFQVTITLHDLMGIFADLDYQEISRKFGHHHPFCDYERAACDARCVNDCQIRCNEMAEKKGAPFLFDCWKGGRELVVPLLQNGIHVATIFVGVFKGEKEGLSAKFKALQNKLPTLEDPHKLATILYFLAQGILFEVTEAHEFAISHGDRKNLIRRYICHHAHQPLCLADLAKRLSLSPSHTSHLVSQLFGASFQQLLLQERIRRAQGLLRTTKHSLETIAERTGFMSTFYFSRQFKRIVGMPPGKYRAQNQGESSTG